MAGPEELYQQMWEQAYPRISTGEIEPDPLIDDPSDTRRGLTLAIRPSSDVAETIREKIAALHSLEPDQYFYPTSDLHITALSIISAVPGFTLDQIRPVDYIDLITEALHGTSSFEIELKGITATPSAVMICGYPVDDALNRLRDSLRHAFADSHLLQSIDKRYRIQTAHITAIRFRSPLSHSTQFATELEELRKASFGSFTVNELEFITNDWYRRGANTQYLHSFSLSS